MKSILAVLAILAIPAAASAQGFVSMQPYQPRTLMVQPDGRLEPAPETEQQQPIYAPQPYRAPYDGGFTATTHQFGDITHTQIDGDDGESVNCTQHRFGNIVHTSCD